MPATSVPLVSVLIPVRSGRYFAPALDSILVQTAVDFEVICIDDGADTLASGILREASANGQKFRILRNSGHGIADALNTGLASARGELIARMDADDICLPHRLATQAAYLRANPEIGVLGTQAVAIDASGARLGRARVPVGRHRVFEYLQTGSPLIHPTVMMRRSLLRKVGGYRRVFEGAEDYDLWLRLSAQTAMDNLAAVFLLLRRHGEQVTTRSQFRQARLSALAIVSDKILRAYGCDPLPDPGGVKNWREAIGAVSPSAVADVRELTASRLVDNRGTLRASGGRYLNGACYRAIRRGSPEVCSRLALACVRHQLLLFRAGRRFDALKALARDAMRWRTRLVFAYVRHASIPWLARRSSWRVALTGQEPRDTELSSPSLRQPAK